MRGRRGSLFVEILMALVLFVVVFVPLLSSFGTGVRQTRAIKSYVVAESVAEWALGQAVAAVVGGLGAAETDVDLTADALATAGASAGQLEGLRVVRTVTPEGTSGSLFEIRVLVTWRDAGRIERAVAVRSLARREV